jgi:hypothetical protein
MHRIKHDVKFIQRLIPKLHKAGVYNLAIEFARQEDQALADKLINSDRYDESIARKLIFKCLPYWAMKEYQDIYRTAWRVNKGLTEGQKRFRIINLNYNPEWKHLEQGNSKEIWKKVLYKGPIDPFMAKVLSKEILDKNEKAAVFCGRHHTFTKFNQPILISKSPRKVKYLKQRFGNIIFRQLKGKQVYSILLHAPFYSNEDKMVLPADGKIDEIMSKSGYPSAGIDLNSSPFGNLKEIKSQYAAGPTPLRLKDMYDGYIFLKPIDKYEGCTIDHSFITDKNFQEFLDTTRNIPTRSKSVKEFLEAMKCDVDMKSKFEEILENKR